MDEASPHVGLMTAIAPIARKRPVHIIVSGGPGDSLTVVVMPKQMDPKEDPTIARGFTVAETPEVLDRELGPEMARSFVPSHQRLQSVLEQAASANEAARQATLRKGAKPGAAKAPAPAAPQITFEPPPAAAADEPVAAAAPAGATAPPASPEESPPGPAESAEGDGESGGTAAVTTEAAAAPVADAVSNLFD